MDDTHPPTQNFDPPRQTLAAAAMAMAESVWSEEEQLEKDAQELEEIMLRLEAQGLLPIPMKFLLMEEAAAETEIPPETFGFRDEIKQLFTLVVNIFYPNIIPDVLEIVIITLPVPESGEPELFMDFGLTEDLARNLVIMDRGIGLTEADLLDNLRTSAPTGSKEFMKSLAAKEFMKALNAGAEASIIGQFGSRFYTAYAVAEHVAAPTELMVDEQYVWEAGAAGFFFVTRGHHDSTRITLILRNDVDNEHSEFISLKDYITRMEKDHIPKLSEELVTIDHITRESKKESNKVVEKATFNERLEKKGYEVQLSKFERNELVSATKKGLKLIEREDEKKKEAPEKFEGLCKVIKEVLGDKVEKVVVSDRVMDSPCCLVTGEYGWTANIEMFMLVQTLRYLKTAVYMPSKKMAINPENPIIQVLRERLDADKNDNLVRGLVVPLLFETSLVSSGYSLDEHETFCNRVQDMVNLALNCDEDEVFAEEEVRVAKKQKKEKAVLSRKTTEITLLLAKTADLRSGGTLHDPQDFAYMIHLTLKLILGIDKNKVYMPLVWPLQLLYGI